jgi:hypothetical protein
VEESDFSRAAHLRIAPIDAHTMDIKHLLFALVPHVRPQLANVG